MEKRELKQSHLAQQWKEVLGSDGSTRNVQLLTRFQELQDYFDSERNSLLTRNRDIEDREKEWEAKVLNFNLEMEAKARKLQEIESLAEEKGKEVEFKTIKLGLIQKSMVECCNTLESKEEVIGAMEKRTRKLAAKKRELEGLVDKLEFRRRQVEKLGLVDSMVTECLNEVQLEGKQLHSCERSLQGCSGGVEKKERIEELAKELELERKQIDSVIQERRQHFDSQEKMLTEGSHGLEMKKRQLEEKAKELDLKQKQFDSVIQERQKHLDSQESSLQERSCALEVKDRLLEDQIREFESKQKQFDLMIQGRQQRLDSQEKMLLVSSHGLEMKEKQLEKQAKELELKQKQFDLMVHEHKKHLDSQEKLLQDCFHELQMKWWQVEEQVKELELKRKQFDAMVQESQKQFISQEKLLHEFSNGLEMKERNLEEHVKEFESNQNVFVSMIQEDQRHLDSQKKWLQERSHGLQMKERQFEEQVKEFESKQKQSYSLIQERQQHLDSQEKLLQESSHGLEMREMQLQEQVKELESKHKEFDSIRKSTEEHIQNLKSKEKTNVHPEVDNDQQLLCTPATIINRDGRGLQLLMNEHLKRIDLVGTEISTVLQVSSDPAKLVLNAMQGFYPSNLTGDNSETFDYDLRVIRRSCILLLQELKIFSPQISPQVREDAMNLAADWKAKMTMASENDMEVLGFLKLVTVYDITTACDPKELQSLLTIVAQHGQASELCQALKTTNKAPASNSISFPVKVEEPESSPVRNVLTSSSPNLQPGATTDATNMQGSLNEHSSGNPPMQNEMFVALQMSLHPEKLAFKLIKTHLDQCWGNRDVGLGAVVMENTISLLIDLAKVTPLVGSDVKKDAKELAVQWKAKLRADSENSFEILGFLQFISTYELLSAFNKDEIVKLFGMIYLDEMALNSHRTLGLSDKIPGKFLENRHSYISLCSCSTTIALEEVALGAMASAFVHER
ncbi:uncharacterized protein [Malus domestica]|uniref:uncharacterized protein isoform X1 n=1 Tax=Malus domestica TaxID=3750 RepID=UPI0039764B1F